MKFFNLTEAIDQQRNKLWAQFRRDYQITYGKRLDDNPQLFARYLKIFSDSPMEEINYYLDQIKGKARTDYRKEVEYQARKQRLADKEQKRAVHTDNQTYLRVEDDVERVVCANEDPGFDKTGMPCFPGDLTGQDKNLKGYYSIHVGDARRWIPILMRDAYCDGSHAYIYTIKTSELARTKTPFWKFGYDYHISDASETPDSDVIFSKLSIIPAKYIILDDVIDLKDVEEAPDLS